MKRMTNPLARAAVASSALFIIATFSTCDFLTSDVFPRWLSYVEASVDFRAITVAQGLGSDATIENLEFAPYVTGGTDYSKVLVYATGNSTNRLILLSPESMEYKFTPTGAGFTRALTSVSNGFLCGTQIVDPLNPGNTSASPIWTNATSVRVFRVGNPVTGLNYVVDPNSSLQGIFAEYPSAWGAATVSVTRDFDSLVGNFTLLDSDFANGYSVLSRRHSNGQGYTATFASAALFWAGGTVFDSAAAIKTGPFPVADDLAWLTDGGPVAYSRGDKGVNRLVRYKWGTGDFTTGAPAQEIDSLAFDEEDVRILSFDPSGTWWFIYDRVDGRLYKLRTWWK